jgi:hypothetical protein
VPFPFTNDNKTKTKIQIMTKNNKLTPSLPASGDITKAPAAALAESQPLSERDALLTRLKLPDTTTDEELAIILAALPDGAEAATAKAFLDLVAFVLASTRLSEDEARDYVQTKFPLIPTSDDPVDAGVIPNNRAEFLNRLGLPDATTEKELAVILQANGGTALPLKKAVFKALVTLTMRAGKPEHEALEYVVEKFPTLNPPDAHRKTEAAAKDSLRDSLLELYGLPADATDADIAAAAAAAQNENLATKATRLQEEADESAIAVKMSKGLSREQAASVIRRQREHDAELKRAHDERRPKIVKIIQESRDLKSARKQCQDELGILEGSEFKAAVEHLNAATARA